MTHEKEIKYWAEHPDGTSVWIQSKEHKWMLYCCPSWLPNNLYIVDDEWAKLRLANANGETIQFNIISNKWLDEKNDWWKSEFFNAVEAECTPSEFRVKPKEWYEDIPPEGVICWVWDEEEDKRIEIITRYSANHMCPFYGKTCNWKFAEPVKPEECLQSDKS